MSGQCTDRVRARVVEAGPAPWLGVASMLQAAGMPVTTSAGGRDTVLVAAAATMDSAMDACRPAVPAVVVAGRLTRAGARRAVRLGVHGLLRVADLEPHRLAEVVRAARHGDRRMPHEVLAGLLAGDDGEAAGPTPLTPRQTTVLTLMADGHGNAAIARALCCSEHTVKNVVYELMGRLQARNRAHAVAQAVRAGLI